MDAQTCEQVLANQPYLGGKKPNADDAATLEALGGNAPDQAQFPLFFNWFTIVSLFHQDVVNAWKTCPAKKRAPAPKK